MGHGALGFVETGFREHPVKAKTVTLTPLTPLSLYGRGGKIKTSPLSPCGRGVGGEGDYKNGTLPGFLPETRFLALRNGAKQSIRASKIRASKIQKAFPPALQYNCRHNP
jgi:hypothetical protein